MLSPREIWMLLRYAGALLAVLMVGELVFGIPDLIVGIVGIPIGLALGVHLVHHANELDRHDRVRMR